MEESPAVLERSPSIQNARSRTRRLSAKREQAAPADAEQRNALVLSHRILARRMAKGMLRKWRCYCPLDELHSIVDIALCEAAKAYSPEFGTKFTTFCFYHIKGRLVREVIRDRVQQRVMKRLDISVRTCEDLDHILAACAAWAVEAAPPPSPDELVAQKQMVNISRKALSDLSRTEQEIIERLYKRGEPASLVAAHLGYSRGHVSRLHTQALKKMKKLTTLYQRPTGNKPKLHLPAAVVAA